MGQNRETVLFIAMSLDGYIAAKNDDLSFLSMVEQEGEDYGYAEFMRTIDTVVMGRRTYDKVLSMGMDFPHADKECYIITRTSRPSEGTLHFYTGAPAALLTSLMNKSGKNIFVDGGAEIVNQLLRDRLVDELVISIIPVLLGDGISLFNAGLPEQRLKLISSESFGKGLIQLRYKVIR